MANIMKCQTSEGLIQLGIGAQIGCSALHFHHSLQQHIENCLEGNYYPPSQKSLQNNKTVNTFYCTHMWSFQKGENFCSEFTLFS